MLKHALRDLTPPALWRLARGLRRRWRGEGAGWLHVPGGWNAAGGPQSRGWSAPGVTAVYEGRWSAWSASLDGPGPLIWGHEAPMPGGLAEQNTHLVFAYALARAAWRRESVRVLDWGGGPGHYARLARALLPEVPLEYHICDLTSLVALGRQLQPEVYFHDEESWAAGAYDLVLASGSLHFTRDWPGKMVELARVTAGYLLVTRLPTTTAASSYVFVQRAASTGYDTEYPGWCLAEAEFHSASRGAGLVLVREFLIGEAPEIEGAPGPCQYRGYLLRPGG